MKKLMLALAVSIAATVAVRGDTNTLWDFNLPTTETVFPSGDSDPTTGTFTPLMGSGTLNSINVGATSFGSPPAGGGVATSDPWSGDNSALRMGTFPTTGSSNKTAGFEFFTSTVGYENIQVTFDQENSATASKYWRVQYTTNGSTWQDFVVMESAGSTSWILQRLVDFSAVPGVKDNPNFGFRYVSEWVSTATGSGPDGYTANSPGSSYGTGGTLWVDMVTVFGTPLDTSNTDPTISSIDDRTNSVNQAIGPIAFTIGDAETAPQNLILSYESSNPTLIQNVVFGGSGANRTVTLTPEMNQSGLTMITIIVRDEGGKLTSTSFNVLVRGPEIILGNQGLAANSSKLVNFTITEYSGFTGAVTLSAETTNSTLFPNGSLVLGGSGANRTLTITPAANQTGGAEVVLVATDGALLATNAIFVTVLPENTIIFWNFNSETRDFNEGTGTLEPLFGSGVAQSVGGVLSSVVNTITADSFDLDTADNTKWRLGTFAAQGTSNKLTGVEFRLSTVGYQDIEFSWNHYNSATASRYWRVQYSTDGVNFTDHLSYSNVLVTTWFETNATFTGISGVNNNPNFAVRIVSEFESTAENGANPANENYVGVQESGGYGAGGTLWLDLIEFRGAPFTGVTPATLTVSRSGNDVKISWPASAGGTLQSTTSLTSPDWQTAPEAPVDQDGTNTVTIVNPTNNRFFRLLQ